jgi:hypothetical protein
MHRLAEQAAMRERREEQHCGDRKHQHLRAQAGATAVGDKDPPRRGEAEQRVIEHKPERAAEQEQRTLLPRIGVAERDRAGAKDGRSKNDDPGIDGRSRAALVGEQACVNGKIGHGRPSNPGSRDLGEGAP